jgi:hypothetical protein
MRASLLALALTLALALLVASPRAQQPQTPVRPDGDAQGFRFKSGVELINVTATVSDANGRFVPGLRQEDFLVYEDEQPVEVTHFSAERVPVSLGIALDTSGSMAGEKIQEAQAARSAASTCSIGRTRSSYRFSTRPVRRSRDQGFAAALAGARACRAQRRHRHVRRRRRIHSTDAAGTKPQEGAAGHLRRQRHGERDDGPRAQGADP